MICNEIAKQSILYIDKLLKKSHAKRFEKHLQKCEKCRSQFDMIALNYDGGITGVNTPDMKADIMSKINHSLYTKRNQKHLMRKWVVIAAGLVLTIGVSVNAQEIYRSLEELIKNMKPTNEYREHMIKAAGGDRTAPIVRNVSIPLEEYDDMFAKIEEKVFEKGNQMLPGEFVEIPYPDLYEGFYVKLYKLSNGKLSIVYGIKEGYQIGIGEHNDIFLVGASSDKNMIQQTIHSGFFIALPDYLPEKYSFKSIVTSDGHVERVIFSDGNGNQISIDYEFYTDYKFEEFESSLVRVKDMQAIYLESETGYKVLHVYLGDHLDKKIIKLMAQGIGKEELFQVAESLVFYNEESNQLNKENYFKEIKDQRLESIFDEVISREKAGEKMFEIVVSEKKGDGEIVRFNKNDAGPGGWCTVNYTGMSYEDVKKSLNYPLVFDKTSFSRYKLIGAAVTFRPFREVKTVNYSLMPDNGDIKQQLSVEARGLPMEYKRYTKLDYLMMKYISDNDTRIIQNHEGEHYAVRIMPNGIIIDTVKEVDGRYVSYTIDIPSELYAGMAYEEIINHFDFIE